jgi:hypothetical protein
LQLESGNDDDGQARAEQLRDCPPTGYGDKATAEELAAPGMPPQAIVARAGAELVWRSTSNGERPDVLT